MVNLAEFSRQDGQWQGIIFDFWNHSGQSSLVSEFIDSRFIAMYTHGRYGIL